MSATKSPDAVPEAVVRRELERLLASHCLRDSELLKRFLRYIVEATLAGEGNRLKEYRLGLEVFGRDSSFDPKLDPVVRMTALRLRQKLQEYYEGDDRKESIRIEIPKGGYAARFVAGAAQELPNVENAANPLPEKEIRIPVPEPRPRAGKRGLPVAAVFVAVLVTAALIAAYFYYYYYRSRQTRLLNDTDTIVLADFANSTGDPVFDETLKTALVVSLQQSPFLNVLSEQKAAAILQTMNRPAGTKLTDDVTREVCQRAGSKAYISGAIARLGNEYVLGLKAANCQNGEVFAREQTTAASREKVLDMLGQSASRLRGEMGESLATLQRFDVPLAEATTSSLDALKAYSTGVQAFRENGPAAALPFAQRAIGIDPNFAMAYDEAGMDYSSLGEVGRASEYFRKAFQLREHASDREKLAITALYYRAVTGELDKAVKTRQELVSKYPREFRGYISLGTDFASEGEYEKAIEVTRTALSLNPDHVVPYDDLATYLLALQRFDEARLTVHQAQARKLDNLLLHNVLYAIAFLGADSTAMAEQQKWFVGRPEENYGLALSSDTEAYIGREAKARELTRQAVESAVRADSKETGATWQENSALRDAAYGYAEGARRTAAAGLKLAPSSQGVEVEAALAFAMANDTARAESAARDLDKAFPLDTQVQSLWLPAIRAQLALDRKNPAAALKALQDSAPVEMGLIPFVNNISCLYPLYVRGEAYLAAGQGRAAAAEFQKILDHSGIVQNCWTGALAHLGAARANALQDRISQGADADAARVRALVCYKDFFTLWKDSDSGVPILKEAKTEFAKLQ